MSTEAEGWSYKAWNIYSSMIGHTTAIINIVVILIVFTRSLRGRLKQVSVKIQLLTIICLTLLLFALLWRLLDWYGIWVKNNIPYGAATSIYYLIINIVKTLLSSIYVARLQMVYDKTAYCNSKCTKILLWSTVIVYGITFTVINLYAAFVDETPVIVSYKGTDIQSCGGDFPSYAIIPYTIFDIIFPTVTMILFVKPLYQIIKRGRDPYLKNVATKYSVLTCTAIITSIVFGVVLYGYFNILISSAIDVIITTNCILLYERRMSKYYDCLCCLCYRSADKATPELKIDNNTTDHDQSQQTKSKELNAVK